MLCRVRRYFPFNANILLWLVKNPFTVVDRLLWEGSWIIMTNKLKQALSDNLNINACLFISARIVSASYFHFLLFFLHEITNIRKCVAKFMPWGIARKHLVLSERKLNFQAINSTSCVVCAIKWMSWPSGECSMVHLKSVSLLLIDSKSAINKSTG